MLFHVSHTHVYQKCMAHHEDARTEFDNGFTRAAAANEIKTSATYNNLGRYTRIWILETEKYSHCRPSAGTNIEIWKLRNLVSFSDLISQCVNKDYCNGSRKKTEREQIYLRRRQ